MKEDKDGQEAAQNARQDWPQKPEAQPIASEVAVSAFEAQIAGHTGVELESESYASATAETLLERLREVTSGMDEAQVTTGSRFLFITKDCEQVDLALQFLNFVYDEDFCRQLYSGAQGVTWDYDENGVPKMVNIYIGEDKVLTVEFPYAKQVHYVEFNQLVPTKLIMLEISSVYEGSIYTDTCIAEVEIYGSTEAE